MNAYEHLGVVDRLRARVKDAAHNNNGRSREDDPNYDPDEGIDEDSDLGEGGDQPSSKSDVRKQVKHQAAATEEDAKTLLAKNAEGLKTALGFFDVELRYNLLASKPEIKKAGGDWKELNDRKEAKLFERISRRFAVQTSRGPVPLVFGLELRRDKINALLCDLEVNPFLVWLESLPKWDGTPRADNWMCDLFEAEKNDLIAWVSRFVFLGAVWRSFKPGTKLDEMPVMAGPQGIGKSTALRLCLPPGEPSWFADGLHLADDPKIRAEALQGRVIVEAAEMAGSTKADLESLKAFLSRQDDGMVRLAYRRNPETMLRRCIIVGTTNSLSSLPNDPAGNRRFVPVELRGGSAKAVKKYMDRHREQLWAEALHLYNQGVEAWLPERLKPAQSMAAEAHRQKDEMVEDVVSGLAPGEPLTFDGIADLCGMSTPSMREQHRIGRALENSGWVKRRTQIEGKQRYLWHPPT